MASTSETGPSLRVCALLSQHEHPKDKNHSRPEELMPEILGVSFCSVNEVCCWAAKGNRC